MKYSIYILISLLLASLVLLRAFYLRPNFWSATILLSQSNGSLLILTNLALIWTGGTVYLLQRFFYGQLRPIEVEQLYERGWVAVTETALALTIFREDVGARFFVMFLSLMVGKIWAWIGEGRIEFMEQQPSASRLPTIRLAASLTVSLLFDVLMLSYCLETLAREPRPGMWVMYAFEYVILLIQSTSLFLRFTLDVTESVIVHRQTQARIQARRDELRREREEAREQGEEAVAATQVQEDVDEMDIDVPGWEDKGRWMFYLDLMTDFIKSLVYCGFFMVLLFFHGLPLHIMRDLYITVRSFVKRITDFIQYRNATKDMNARYPDATAAELQADNTCIICREEMTAWEEVVAGNQQPANRRLDERQRPKKLPCGHILHFACLRSWLERQRVCPTCRRSVLTPENTSQNTANQANGGPFQPPNNGAQQAPANNQQPGLNNQHPQPGGAQQPNQFRVVNFGPLRIAFGRTQGPGGVQNILHQMANRQQQMGQVDQQAALAPSQQVQNNIIPSPLAIHQQIVQLQTQVLQLMQRLHGEHLQLDVLERLVTELVRLQTEQHNPGSTAPPAQTEGLSTTFPWHGPQAFHTSTNQPTMNAGSAGLPSGMVLPPGYTLQRLQPVDYSQAQPSLVAGSGSSHGGDSAPSGTQQRDDGSEQASRLRPGSSGDGDATASSSTATGSSTSILREGDDSIRQRNPRAATVEDA